MAMGSRIIPPLFHSDTEQSVLPCQVIPAVEDADVLNSDIDFGDVLHMHWYVGK